MWVTEADMNFRVLGLAVVGLGVGNPASQGKLRVQQKHGDQGGGARGYVCALRTGLCGGAAP